jgi:hypothetical protein
LISEKKLMLKDVSATKVPPQKPNLGGETRRIGAGKP